jgi:hypothetical protein
VGGLSAAELETLRAGLRDPVLFARLFGGRRLYAYQAEVLRAIVEAVVHRRGGAFVVIFPRQSGKNELQAHLAAYLLTLFSQSEAELVAVSPTWKPQAETAMRRLERVLGKNLLLQGRWQKEGGTSYRVGGARVSFLSAEPSASVVGATASLLLWCDEAQDVLPEKWDKDFAPMAASTDAVRVFWGTAWTETTLLARMRREAEAAQAAGGPRRVFLLTAEAAGRENPAYRRHVAEQVARLGRTHPLVRTQYFSEEVAEVGGLFGGDRLARMQGPEEAESEPLAGALYALLVDVGGEAREAGSTDHDATAALIVRVEPGAAGTRYCAVARRRWTGASPVTLHAELTAWADEWRVAQVVIDATGVGAGLAAFLERSLPGRVQPFVFSQKSKSELGWAFLGLVDGGRWQDVTRRDEPLTRRFWEEVGACRGELGSGPGRTLTWGVPDGTRSPSSGQAVHDDLLIAAALTARLEGITWATGGAPLQVAGIDPLTAMDQEAL